MLRRLWVLLGLLWVSTLAIAQVALVPAGSAWKFLDNGTDPGTAWRALAYDDALWRSGNAKLGYGQGDEATVVSYGSSSSAKYTTTYFRRLFTVADAAALTSLTLKVRRDDGIVVYLNGSEVYRNNMPSGAVTSTTRASSTASDEGQTWMSATLAASAVAGGTNVVTAEVHQASASSSDLVFDLDLSGVTGSTGSAASLTRGPYLQSGSSTGVTLRWRTNLATDSVVRFGSSAAALNSVVSDAASTTEHVVTLTGLSPDSTYHYAIGSSSATLAGGDANHRFTTYPAAGSTRATRIWVIGDAGTGTSMQRSVRDAYAAYTGSTPTHLWLQLGDNAYNSGSDSEYQSYMFNVYGDQLRSSVT